LNYVQLFLMRPELTMMLRWRMAHDRNFVAAVPTGERES